MFLVILLFALFASLFGLSKSTLDFAEPFFLIGARMFVAGLLLSTYAYFRYPGSLQFLRRKPFAFLALGFLNIYLTNVTEIWGLQHMTSAKACLIYSLSPFLSALVAYFLLAERLNGRKWIGLIIGFLGLWPILFIQTDTERTAGMFSLVSFAELSLLAAVLFSVYGWILLKKLVQEQGCSPWFANGISMTFGGAIALMHSYWSGEVWQPIPVTQLGPFLQNTALMALISNIICYNLYGYLLKRYSATFMSFAGLVTPLFASLFGWLFLNEPITWPFFASMLIFAIGLSLFYQEELRRVPSLEG